LLSNKVNYWTGNEGRLFEKEFAEFVGTKFAIAVTNGTVALDLALLCADLDHEDEVIVTSRTFIASASSIISAGAIPVFADVDPITQNITAESIAAVLTSKTKAIIVVHLAGMPADMDPIMALASKNNLFVVEDCAQAHGAKYKGRSVGSIGHIGAWSFCQDKIMTTGGEGGFVTVNDEAFWKRMWSYKDHGKSYDVVYNKKHPPGYRWVHESFGTNFRMMEIQAVIGRIQLRRLSEWTAIRTKNAELLNAVARKTPLLRTITVDSEVYVHAWYKWYAFVNREEFADGWSRNRLIERISAEGIPCMQGTCSEIYLEGAFSGTNYAPKVRLRVARELGDTSISMLVHPTITQEEMALSCNALERACKEALRVRVSGKANELAFTE
jgi:dTDP-4-amino-4,6-dideoxygalactose transaminase